MTSVLFASASMVMLPAKVTGPVKLIAPSAVSVETRLPERLIPSSPIRVIEPELAVDPKVIVPVVLSPSSRRRDSSVPPLVIAPVISIFPPPLLISNSPLAITTGPVSMMFASAVSTFGAAAEKVIPVLPEEDLMLVVPPNL